MCSNAMTDAFIRRGKVGHRCSRRTPCGDTQTWREDGPVKMEAEIEGMLPQPRDVWATRSSKRQRKNTPLEVAEGAWSY